MRHLFLTGAALAAMSSNADSQTVQGVGAVYDAVTLAVDGPKMDERTGENPFSDVRLNVSFSNGEEKWIIPGYFVGCKDVADNGCNGGNIWKAHFLPPLAGEYQWQMEFRRGADVAISSAKGDTLNGDGAKGSFTVKEMQTDPIKARGIVQYTGEHYYRYSGDRNIFWKFGPDAPENMLAYDDYDATTNFKTLRKNWSFHQPDYNARDAKGFTWGKDKKGTEILGMLRYVTQQKMNGISALTWSTSGDDRNVFPHLLAVDAPTYEAMERKEQWRAGLVQDRFDLSKLAQWQRTFDYADKLGLHINFKLQEQENDKLMDDGALGRTRKLYLREMVSRFGHYLAASWNMGEENSQQPGDVRQMSQYIDALDAYDRPIVIHSFIPQKERYRPLLGDLSALNGMSLQGYPDTVRAEMVRWRNESERAGRSWVLSLDEQGSAKGGTGVDEDYPAAKLPQPRKEIVPREYARRMIVWNALTAGANGGEAYYGYETGCSDLTCQDHRTRASLWKDSAVALEFFRKYVGDKALDMEVFDELTLRDANDFVFAQPGQTYVVVKGKEPIAIQLPGAETRFTVDWYDMIEGGALQKGSKKTVEIKSGFDADTVMPVPPFEIGNPPAGGSGEWVALVRRDGDEAIMVEAERFDAQRNDNVRRWFKINASTRNTPLPDPDPVHSGGASGGAYVELLPDTRTSHDDKLVKGQNFSEEAGSMAVLSYDVNFPAAGRYYVWTRIYASGTEDNGLHVGLNGEWPTSGRRIQFCPGKDQWYWDSRQRTEAQHCGVRGGIWIDVPTAGKHHVEFAMREDGVEFDAFFLTRDANPPKALLRANRSSAPVKFGGNH